MVLREFMRRALPVGASYAAGAINGVPEELFAEEEQAIARSVPRRRAEYSAGRYYARQAMSGLGAALSAILTAPSRAPVWPCGIVGSISHTDSYCVAVVANASDIYSIGIDIDSVEPLHDSIVRMICTPDELSAASQFTKLYFVVKEAFYKMYFPLTHHFLDFQQVKVSLHLPSNSFTARIGDRSPGLRGDRLFHGHFGRAEGLYIALISLPEDT